MAITIKDRYTPSYQQDELYRNHRRTQEELYVLPPLYHKEALVQDIED